jgi:hypothetical protein
MGFFSSSAACLDAIRDLELRVQLLERERNSFAVEREELLGRLERIMNRIRMQANRALPDVPQNDEPQGTWMPGWKGVDRYGKGPGRA